MGETGRPNPSRSAYLKGGGLAAWSINHPVGVGMIAMAVAIVGFLSFQALAVALLPDIIYPGVRVRVLDSGVPSRIMEDQVTRKIEEQLAITEDAVSVQSSTSEGESRIDLAFEYGKDIDIALRDASTRLDRARRQLPDSADAPMIMKFDPSQIPVAEFVVASSLRDPVEMRDWVDYVFAKWFVNLPGVAAVEVGGGLVREIQVRPDPGRLGGLGLTAQDVVTALRRDNIELAAGRVETPGREYLGRTVGRFSSVDAIGSLPLSLPGGGEIRLRDVAEVVDIHEDERLMVRLDGRPGIKISIQKQPSANTVAVVDAVNDRLEWLRERRMLPDDLMIRTVADQSVYVRNALMNAAAAGLTGALLAMTVVFLFLGDVRRTLVVGTAIPLSILVTIALMALGGLSLNIMTLGGLALGVGMVVDGTIVMLENIHRHQRMGENRIEAGVHAAREVNSAIVASTATNLAAVVPFLFISGLVGLLFRELIMTITAAIIAAMVVALTVVPAFGSRTSSKRETRLRRLVDEGMRRLEGVYVALLGGLLARQWRRLVLVGVLSAGLAAAVVALGGLKEIFLPSLDDGRISINVTADPGIPLAHMDRDVHRLEALFQDQPETVSVFTIVGGRVFGRSQRQTSNSSTILVQLVPLTERTSSSQDWIARMQREIAALGMAGVKVRMRTGDIRGIRVSQGSDDVTLRVSGPDQEVMEEIAALIQTSLVGMSGIRNLALSSEEVREELVFRVDQDRARALGLDVDEVARAARLALEGETVSEFYDGDRSYDIRVRLPRAEFGSIQSLESVLIATRGDGGAIYLGEVASIDLVSSPAEILRDNQRRVIEVTATLDGDAALSDVTYAIRDRLAQLPIPDGYGVYDAGAIEALEKSRRLTAMLLGLALFLVFVVMAVQYESLRNPFIILLGVPFALIGVVAGLAAIGLPLSMPVWLGLIMLSGIVVNNAIVLVEYFEILRGTGMDRLSAVIEAGRVRLRPILMTTLTTVCGLSPLAVGAGEGAEMLQPLAITIVFGLSFSMLVTLVLIPVLCSWLGAETLVPVEDGTARPAPAPGE